jgi:hypothetical protein
VTPEQTRTLAKACGAAQRVYSDVASLARLTEALPLEIARQGVAVLEQLDLLRFHLREHTLRHIIEPPGKPPQRRKAPAATSTRRKAQTPPAKPTAKGKRR